jgi:hypothetical protein
MFGSSILDIIGALDGLLGLDIIRPDTKRGPYMYSQFVFIDWDHSLLMMLVWACLFGWILCHHAASFSKEASMVGAASAIIHWLMDTVVIENTGLTLYPHGKYHFGFGLYEKFPIFSWVLECILSAIFATLASRIMKTKSGADISKACALLAVLSVCMSPWTSPLLLVARLYEKHMIGSWTPLIQALGIWSAYFIPAIIFTKFIDGAERDAAVAKKGE